MPGMQPGSAPAAGGHACAWGRPPMHACHFWGWVATATRVMEMVAIASSSCWQRSLGGEEGDGYHPPTHPPPGPAAPGAGRGVMSLAGLMPPRSIHPSGSSTRDGASGRSLQPPPAGEGDGLGGARQGLCHCPPQPLCMLRCWAPHCSTQPWAHVTLHFRAKSCPASGEEGPAHCLMLCSSGTSGGHLHTHSHSHPNPRTPTRTRALLMPRAWALLQPGGSVSPSRWGNRGREEGVRLGEMWG